MDLSSCDERIELRGDRERKMYGESDDRRYTYGETVRGKEQRSGERLEVHLWRVSGGGQTDGCLNCQREMETLHHAATARERSCQFGHSKFNLSSVWSSDFVRLNPGPYLSTSYWRDRMGKGEGEAEKEAGRGFADNDFLPQGQSGWMKQGKTKPVISWTYERQREGFLDHAA